MTKSNQYGIGTTRCDVTGKSWVDNYFALFLVYIGDIHKLFGGFICTFKCMIGFLLLVLVVGSVHICNYIIVSVLCFYGKIISSAQ